MSMLSECSTERLKEIVANATCYKDVMEAIGYKAVSGSVQQKLRERLQAEGISTEHFLHATGNKIIKRTVENTLCKDSTATRKVARKFFAQESNKPYICEVCGQEPFWNGKEMTLILDHINGHNMDHRIENLRWVCPNCNSQLETTGSRNIKKLKEEGYQSTIQAECPPVYKEKQRYFCIDCGAEITKDSLGRCVTCAHILQRVVDRPNRDTLKQLIRTTPFTKIGEQYGVSDNAIRKWCDAEGLPRKASDIKKYTDEEWAQL